MRQYVVLSFFSYTKNKFWAFAQMQRAIPELQQQSGIQFFRTLGTGAGLGFSLWPDFSTYALLTIWESKDAATAFLNESNLMETYNNMSHSQKHFSLHTLQSHGFWGKTNPFVAENYRNLNEVKPASISYKSSSEGLTSDAVNNVTVLTNRLEEVQYQEIERGTTLIGPHRDDLTLTIGDFPAKGYAHQFRSK